MRERERERESWGGGSKRHYNSGGGVGNNIFGLKVPRHCPLVLMIGVRLEFRINSTFFYFFIIFFLILVLLESEGLHWNEI
jgi:hypothetical protein